MTRQRRFKSARGVRLAVVAAAATLVVLFVFDQRSPGVEGPGTHRDRAETEDVVATHEEAKPAEQLVSPHLSREGETGRTPVVQEEEGRLVVARVLSRVTKRPVVGASVYVGSSSGTELQTDSTGRCAFNVGEDDETVYLRVSAAGFEHSNVIVNVDDFLDVLLRPTVVLRGRILDVHRMPIAGAQIQFSHPNCSRKEADLHIGHSGVDGSYELHDVPVGARLGLGVEAQGFPMWTGWHVVEVSAQEATYDIIVPPGVSLSGWIIDYDTSEPVTGAEIDVLGFGSSDSGEDGRFTFEISAGNEQALTITVSADGYARIRREVTATSVTAQGGLTVPLPKAARFEGVVRDASGQRVENALVVVAEDRVCTVGKENEGQDSEPFVATHYPRLWPDWRFDSSRQRSQTTTDSEGRFEASGFVAWIECYRIIATHDLHGAANEIVPLLCEPGESAYVELTVKPVVARGSLYGTLRVNGQAAMGKLKWRNSSDAGEVVSAPNGEYRIDGLNPGGVFVDVVFPLCSGPVSGREFPFQFVVEGKDTKQDVELRCREATIAGRVVDTSGEGVADLRVTAALDGCMGFVSGLSRDGGGFSLRVPDVGDYMVSVAGTGYVPSRRKVSPGTSDVMFVVEESCPLALAIVDEGGKEYAASQLRGLQLSWRRGPNESFALAPFLEYSGNGVWATELPSGRLDLLLTDSLTGLEPSLFDGVVHECSDADALPTRLELYRPATLLIDLELDSALPGDIALVLVPAGDTGRVVFEQVGSALVPSWSTASRPEERPLRTLLAGGVQTNQLEGLREGAYEIVASTDAVISPKLIHVSPGSRQRVSLLVQRRSAERE